MTVTELRSGAARVLREGGYDVVGTDGVTKGTTILDAVFEDDYSVVGLVVYDSWSELSTQWTRAQEELVDLITQHVSRDQSKAWDGYLVLITPAEAGGEGATTLSEIRYDTTSVRKLAAAGELLRTQDDLRTVLLPLLPLGSEVLETSSRSILDALPDVLESAGRERSSVECIVEAYRAQQDVLEALHRFVKGRP